MQCFDCVAVLWLNQTSYVVYVATDHGSQPGTGPHTAATGTVLPRRRRCRHPASGSAAAAGLRQGSTRAAGAWLTYGDACWGRPAAARGRGPRRCGGACGAAAVACLLAANLTKNCLYAACSGHEITEWKRRGQAAASALLATRSPDDASSRWGVARRIAQRLPSRELSGAERKVLTKLRRKLSSRRMLSGGPLHVGAKQEMDAELRRARWVGPPPRPASAQPNAVRSTVERKENNGRRQQPYHALGSSSPCRYSQNAPTIRAAVARCISQNYHDSAEKTRCVKLLNVIATDSDCDGGVGVSGGTCGEHLGDRPVSLVPLALSMD
jgi:hypothetical protein